ncbi:CHAT domain-containing protein [Pseudanabaena minima]|uniref:CHAT domain-containing protein n=1 Tax=Pseudanabaena minima TaxID=890415 RepID=UPI003DAA48B1
MQRRQILKAIPFFISTWASATYAQNRPDDAVRLFDLAASKHKRELRDLWKARNAPSIRLSDVSSESIARVLKVRSEDSRIDRRGRYGEITYPDRTALLFYSYDKENLQVWLVDALGIQAYESQRISKQHISEAIIKLRNSLNVDSLQRSRVPRLRERIKAGTVDDNEGESQDHSINNLTQILLPTTVANKLDTVEHLIIVPILEIGIVPFAILRPFRDNSFLIDRMSISIAPSLFDLSQALHEDNSRGLLESPLIVGNPYLPKSTIWSVPPLPGAEKEAQAVAKMMNAIPLLRKEATKAEIVSRARTSSLLYFATHGVASSQNPLSDSFLMLSAERFDQGWWTAQEIQSTRLRARIAILSACQTGLGKAHDAGIIGLSRAFQIAGVPRVVMSLWSVDDQATSQLMQTFIKHLETQFPSEALRQAMLEVRQEYSEPSKWASFVVFGTPR